MQTVGFPYNFSLREHLRRVIATQMPEFALLARWTGDLPGWRAGLRERLRTLIDAKDQMAPVEARLLGQERREGYTLARLAMAVSADLAVPAYLLTPDPPPEVAPAVLCLTARAGGKASLAGELYPSQEATESLGVVLARGGLRVLLPDLPGSGERAGDRPGLAETLLAVGDCLVAREAREALLMLRFLQAQPETASGRVALVAMGGTVLAGILAVALAEEVRAAGFHGALEGLAASLVRSNCLQEADSQDWEGLIPGLLPIADLPDILALMAPRPLLLAAEWDAPETARTLRLTDEAYELQGCGPRCESHAEVTAGDFPALAGEFLRIWLSAQMEM